MQRLFRTNWSRSRRAFVARAGYTCGLIAAAFLPWLDLNNDGAAWLDFMCAFGVVTIFFAWPRPIHFDNDGIWQRNIVGRVRKIGWDEVGRLGFVAIEGKTIVGGGDTHTVSRRPRALLGLD